MDPMKPSLFSPPSGGGLDVSPLGDPDSRDPEMEVKAVPPPSSKGATERQKYSTTGFQRRTQQKVVTDFATLSKGTSAAAKPRAALRNVLFNQGASERTTEQEVRGQVEGLKQELEALALPSSLRWRWKEEQQGASLESSWSNIVSSHQSMERMQCHQQEALWELISTELTYINKLLVIKDLVIASLDHLRCRGYLLEVSPQRLFSNLPSILAAHQLFWQQVVFPMLQQARSRRTPLDPLLLEAGCLQFPQRFSCYKLYCWEEDASLEFSHRLMESNTHFRTFVQWVETHPLSLRMRLGNMLAQPHQRITKYSLLLNAVREKSAETHVQNRLRVMISSVNNFLHSINDFLRLQDEALALRISAQRVEGYEVEVISDEIDRFVREICCFDLTCPIRGVSPDVHRKLLLEENLKVRGRKDSKLEVVALLFSDVLLVTKVQKKGERLKVVRPPLALDRTACMALKDGCSFVLVEVGELQSIMNVLIFVATSSESCSSWVNTVQQAKVTLSALRQKETSRLESLRLNPPDQTGPVPEVPPWDPEPADPPANPPANPNGRGGSYADDHTEAYVPSRSVNKPIQQAPYLLGPGSARWPPRLGGPPNTQNPSGNRKLPVRPPEWIELRPYQGIDPPAENENKVAESEITNRHGRIWTIGSEPVHNKDLFAPQTPSEPFRLKTIGPNLPEVDYPTDEGTTVLFDDGPYPGSGVLPGSAPGPRNGPGVPAAPAVEGDGPGVLAVPRDGPQLLPVLVPGSRDGPGVRAVPSPGPRDGPGLLLVPGALLRDRRRDSSSSQSADLDSSPNVSKFSQNLKSPVFRRRRPTGGQQGSTSRTSGAAASSYSSSDSESSSSERRSSAPSDSRSISPRVVTLNSLKPNRGMFFNHPDPDPQIFSESELHEHKKPILKTQRSASIPHILFAKKDDTTDSATRSQSNGTPSPLVGLLERAKERGRDQAASDRGGSSPRVRSRSRSRTRFRAFTAPSPPHSEAAWGDGGGAPELTRQRALTVSKGWREQLVDGDGEDDKNSLLFSDGVNVDWSGWCFDDDEVMDRLRPPDEGLLEGISRSLESWGLKQLDGEVSQV